MNRPESPNELPAPVDDGMADHLHGLSIPRVRLRSTAEQMVELSALPGTTILYVYPRTGRPGIDPPPGWAATPGAMGCTPEACAFRDHHSELLAAGADAVFGLSTQSTDYQREMAERLQLPFEVLSDERFELTDALRLPTFTFDGTRLLKRHTLVIRDGTIEHVFYPVFPPAGHAEQVLEWLRSR